MASTAVALHGIKNRTAAAETQASLPTDAKWKLSPSSVFLGNLQGLRLNNSQKDWILERALLPWGFLAEQMMIRG